MLNLKKEEVESLPQFKRGLYWGPDDTLYKVIRISDRENRDDYYLYVNSLKNVSGLVLPMDLIKDEHIYGYQLPYIPDSKNVDELLQEENNQLDVIAIMKSIFESLRGINEHLILGDVRNTNILIRNNEAFFIDWDFNKKINSKKTLLVCYCIDINKHIIPDSKLSDILKALLSALSIYYNIDIEDFFSNKDLIELFEILKNIKANPALLYYIEYLIEKAKCQDDNLDLQFSDIAEYITPPSSKEKERLVRALPH